MSSCCMSLFVLYLVGECPCLYVVCHCLFCGWLVSVHVFMLYVTVCSVSGW